MRRAVHVLVAATLVVAPGLALAASPPGADSCLGCHTVAADGSPMPTLGSYTDDQIVTAMQEFSSGGPTATVMNSIDKRF